MRLTAQQSTARLERDELGLRGEYVAPESEFEHRLAEVWCDVLDFDRIGLDDDFFDLGGDSLSAMTLAAAVSTAFDVELKPTQIMECNTIRRMLLAINSGNSRPRNLVPARSAGLRPPLFMIHGQYGITFLPSQFMRGFHEDQPVYVFQVPGFDGGDEPYDDIRDIAAHYLRTMLELHPSRPYLIAAFCAGSWIALEMANQMSRRDLNPDRLILMDPALHAAMDDEFLVNRGRISGARIPLLSPLVARAKLAATDAMRRTKFFFRTGHWVNGQDHASFALPAVQKFWVERQLKSLDPGVLECVAIGQHVTGNAARHYQHAQKSMLEAAAYASAKLQLAFRTYRPSRFDGAVDLIVSEKTARALENAAHPLNRVLPNRRVVVFGKTHAEAVAGTESRNANLIQQMVDEIVKESGRADVAR